MTSSTTARRTTSGLSMLVAVTPARGVGEDRAAVNETNAGLRVALADGAGGTGGGARAADDAIAAILAAPEAPRWLDVLREIDRAAARGPGRCTAVVVELTATGLHGASVGDSGAWMFGDDASDLTADALLALVRLPSGGLQDDVGIVLVRAQYPDRRLSRGYGTGQS